MDKKTAKSILDFTGRFSVRAGKIKRFEAHSCVDGDTLAEHHHRLQRLLACIAPHLKHEFPKEKDLVGKISIILTLHDDDEIMVGYDVTTQLKNHNGSEYEKEIRDYKKATTKLGKKTQGFLVPIFAAFRHRNTRATKIAKALDNLAGNSVLIEQKFALINPNSTKFTIEYAEKVLGASKTTDALVDTQIKQMVEYRKYLLKYPKEVEKLLNHNLKIHDLKEKRRVLIKAKELLKIDVLKHKWEPERTLIPLDQM